MATTPPTLVPQASQHCRPQRSLQSVSSEHLDNALSRTSTAVHLFAWQIAKYCGVFIRFGLLGIMHGAQAMFPQPRLAL